MSAPFDSQRDLDADAELVRLCQAGGPDFDDTFQQLMDRHARTIRRRAARILGSEADAEDVVQEVFVAVYRFLDRYRPERPFRNWLSVVTLNACRIELRSRASRERRHEAFRTRGPGETFDVPDPDPMLREWLGEALGDLPEPTRRSILLRVLEGLSYREIAEREGATVPAVKMRVARGLRTLRARIQLDGAIETEVGREESREACVA